jgi:hypothetical protein
MRYRLRTLMIILALGPPMLWIARPFIERLYWIACIYLGLLPG